MRINKILLLIIIMFIFIPNVYASYSFDTYEVGDEVTLIDGSKWYVVSDVSSTNQDINLVSKFYLNNNGTFCTTNTACYKTDYTTALDTIDKYNELIESYYSSANFLSNSYDMLPFTINPTINTVDLSNISTTLQNILFTDDYWIGYAELEEEKTNNNLYMDSTNKLIGYKESNNELGIRLFTNTSKYGITKSITTSDSMYYRLSDHTLDIGSFWGNSKLKRTTFYQQGILFFARIGDNTKQLVDALDSTGETYEGLNIKVIPSFVADSKFVKVTYKVTNNTDGNKTFSLGSYADIQVGPDDKAVLNRLEANRGVKMIEKDYTVQSLCLQLEEYHFNTVYDVVTNKCYRDTAKTTEINLTNYKPSQFNFLGKDYPHTTNVDTIYMADYNASDQKIEDDGDFDFIFEDNASTISSISAGNNSALAFSWLNEEIKPEETLEFSVLIGMGDVGNIPVLDITEFNTTEPEQIKIKGTITDLDVEDSFTLITMIDGVEQKTLLEDYIDENRNFELTMSVPKGDHDITFYIIDSYSLISNGVDKEIRLTEEVNPPTDDGLIKTIVIAITSLSIVMIGVKNYKVLKKKRVFML